MKVLIVGLGSIAQKHIHVLCQIDPEVRLFALRSSKNGKNHDRVVNIYDWDTLVDYRFSFILVCSPSSMHLEHLEKLMGYGVPMMIEKPLFINKSQITAFKRLKAGRSPIYVASNFRFHSVIEFLKDYLAQNPSKVNEVNSYCGSYLPDWRPDQDYSKVYSAVRELGGGVHLDLIHEPDYLVYLFGMPQKSHCENRKVSKLKINSFDTSMILLQYPDFQACIILNYFRRDSKRTLEIVRENDTIFADFIKGEVYNSTKGQLLFKDIEPSVYKSYEKQFLYFLHCMEQGIKPMNGPEEAIEILNLIL